MDVSTEPVIAVIDDPIAGNPTQFALERAIAAMDLEIRVLSFRVTPRRLGAALGGLEALGFCGVAVGDRLAELSAQWIRDRSPTPLPGDSAAEDPRAEDPRAEDPRAAQAAVDCLYLLDSGLSVAADSPDSSGGESVVTEPPPQFAGMNGHRRFLSRTIRSHFADRGRRIEHTLLVGSRTGFTPDDGTELGCASTLRSPPDATDLSEADLIVLGDANLDVFEAVASWPTNDSSTLVIDMTAEGHPAIDVIESSGYRCVDTHRRRAGTLVECLSKWSGRDCSVDVLVDAIEEYLAI